MLKPRVPRPGGDELTQVEAALVWCQLIKASSELPSEGLATFGPKGPGLARASEGNNLLHPQSETMARQGRYSDDAFSSQVTRLEEGLRGALKEKVDALLKKRGTESEMASPTTAVVAGIAPLQTPRDHCLQSQFESQAHPLADNSGSN
jgi:hypothetical protein